ncbi:HPr family phosphocarrier protein [Luminiphilus sp.]|jgi:phosphocarrier protein HPr|nr:HPr family phosphocarrier protein [Halieaceae bacterium]MDA8732331.1 HPr family phosphocarrier protein [Luminiphilus sp.]MDA9798202.1 HPr family phosphocarrier protein [Luminiphilus sp.]|tara:strand:+ start:45 stop:314 length:270 start_codon:yes stop_codon:yes gene_type:complete
MSQKVIKVINPLGIHARPAAKIVECAGRFSSDIWLQYNGKEIDAKSIMSVLMLAAPVDAELGLRIEGSDESLARDALEQLFGTGFGELE